MTPEEKILWKELRNRNFSDTKFRRQVNIGPYIADFLCWRHNLIIEIDGLIHEKRKEHDVHRDKYLRDHGFFIMEIIDLTLTVSDKIPTFPGLNSFRINTFRSRKDFRKQQRKLVIAMLSFTK